MTEKRTHWTLDVLPDPTDSEGAILEFPPDLLETTGWKEGDVLIWTDLGDGTWSLAKQAV